MLRNQSRSVPILLSRMWCSSFCCEAGTVLGGYCGWLAARRRRC
ncbi:uncharacterized protein HMPREF1541_04516 [Cyphellophora europaea CBS 101466]|uniref:Uncharacterized protein n=1 Tax=Cyphellophora europaea (strain CBS 101466) TaxID=1220924 RepID=W2RVA1_CYPE1|nr:uncharacterized protein HMPREF1541_04516 [Cyphellophora europaea CBS 101466]ETN40240.1 hypothetical protein HMPREF1541_04516 [Cyphellophora europaea CBS 101466]